MRELKRKLLLFCFVAILSGTVGLSPLEAITLISKSANTTVDIGYAGQLEYENPLTGNETVGGYIMLQWRDADYAAPSWYDDFSVNAPGSIDGNPAQIWMRTAGHKIWTSTTVASTTVSIHMCGDGNDGKAEVKVDGITVATLDMVSPPGSGVVLIIVKNLPNTTHLIEISDTGAGAGGGDDVATLGAAALLDLHHKWVQWPDLSDINGIDVDATHWGPYLPLWDMQLLADDFYCNKTGPITDIYIWGSYYDDKLPTNGPNNVDFWLDIFSDNPSGPNGWSEPNEWLWTHIFNKEEFDVWPYRQDLSEGYYSPCTGLYKTISDTNCWLYHFHVDPCDAFVQNQGNIYWLVVQACPYTSPLDTNVRFGWKTSTNHWKDDAVWAVGWTGSHGPWNELRYPTGHPFEGDSIDLAFAVYNEPEPPPAPITYVDPNAPGSNNGSSWFNAYNLLQDALTDPNAVVIWVADGTYKPDAGGGQIPGNRSASFVLRNGVAVYGGYAGFGAPNPNARDIRLYESILSGDLAGNDVYVADPCDLVTAPTRGENSYHVVIGSNTNATAILDGFTITAGNANSGAWPDNEGGGMFNSNANCTVNKCKFVENSSSAGGGGMRNDLQSNLQVSNCIFFRNAGGNGGGGVKNYQSSPTLVNCSFISNKGFFNGNNGGGLYNLTSNSTLTNCLFSNNSADYGGAVSNINSSFPTITNCTVSKNLTTAWCGGINNYNGTSTIINNCIIWDNGPSQINDFLNCAAIVNYSDVQGGWTGAGTSNINADPCFVDPDGIDNTIGTLDDNFRLLWISPCIDIGSNIAVPPDTADLDIDNITAEQTPLDLNNRHRFEDGDLNGSFIVDMGAYEFAYVYLGDLDGDGDVDLIDLSILCNNWLLGVP